MSILDIFDPYSAEIIRASDIVTPPKDFPKTILAVFNAKFQRLLSELTETRPLSQAETGCKVPTLLFSHRGVPLALSCVTLGGSGAAGDLEELLALGAKRVLFFGSAGSLDSAITAGNLIVPTAARRDEGTSYHYAPASDYLDIPTADRLAGVLDRLQVPYILARTWTTDAFYRETRNAMEARRAEGCAVVEQECASVMAVGQFRKAEIYQFLYAADCLDGSRWDARILGRTPNELRKQVLRIALDAAVLLDEDKETL